MPYAGREVSEQTSDGIHRVSIGDLSLEVSRTEPILAQSTLKGEELHESVPMLFTVYGGLQKLGRQAPYFTLTYWAHRAGFPSQRQQGGAGHEEILKHFPQFADLAKLHLANIDGVPMYALENGWYWLRGALGLEGSAAASGWKYDYERKTHQECLQIFADLWRLSGEEADTILVGFDKDELRGEDWDTKQREAQLRLKAMVEEMKPRWKKEAQACVANHQLKLFGDGALALVTEPEEEVASPAL